MFKGGFKVLTLPENTATQLFGVKKGFVGFCGNADVWGDVVAWLTTLDGKPPKTKGDVEFLMLNDQGIYHATNMNNWMKIEEPHFSIGSGMQFAMAAMDAGKTPMEAVKLASKRDRSTGMGFKEYSL